MMLTLTRQSTSDSLKTVVYFGRMAAVAAVFLFQWKKNEKIGKQGRRPVLSSVMVEVLETSDALEQHHDRRSRLRLTHDELEVAL
jgi:hypothetical protein